MHEGSATSCRQPLRLAGATALLAAVAALGGCSSASELSLAGAADPSLAPQAQADGPPKGELERAVEYWGKQYANKPRDAKAALSYAKNLKAMGRKKEALAVLQQAHIYHASDREHLSEYGRLALDLGQDSIAAQLLERADDPANPDWRVLSARGTVLAKRGQYKEAITLFERARTLAPTQASVLNNLALAHAMDGEAVKAEGLLREAERTADDPRVQQNLALVLGLQGKFAEAKTEATKGLSEENAQANVDLLRRMVRATPQPDATTAGAPAVAGWSAVAVSREDKSAGEVEQPRSR